MNPTIEDWLKLNQNIKFYSTKKLFFGKFAYALQYDLTFQYAFMSFNEHRRMLYRNARLTKSRLKNYNSHNNTDFKTLVCATGFKIYSTDIKSLHNVAGESFLFDNSQIQLVSVSQPDNDVCKDYLDKGYILTKQPLVYPYVVTIRNGFYDVDELKSLSNYLSMLRDQGEVKISTTAISRLSTSRGYFTGCKVSLKDNRLTEFIRIICPSIIGANQEKININT
jgi:hypothetical protein